MEINVKLIIVLIVSNHPSQEHQEGWHLVLLHSLSLCTLQPHPTSKLSSLTPHLLPGPQAPYGAALDPSPGPLRGCPTGPPPRSFLKLTVGCLLMCPKQGLGFGDKGPVCGEQWRDGLWGREEGVKVCTESRWGHLAALLGY